MTFSIEIFVVILMLRLIISSEFVSDDTLKIDTMNNRIVEILITNKSSTFRNRLARETAKSKSICFSEIASMKDELLMTKLSIDD